MIHNEMALLDASLNADYRALCIGLLGCCVVMAVSIFMLALDNDKAKNPKEKGR